jgi:hypothetical protein
LSDAVGLGDAQKLPLQGGTLGAMV